MLRHLFGLSQPADNTNDQDPDPETPDDDGDQGTDPETPDDDGDQNPDPQNPDDDDQSDSSDSSDSSDNSDDDYLDYLDYESLSSGASQHSYKDYPYPLFPPQSRGSWETDWPEAEAPLRPDDVNTTGPEPPEDGSSDREDPLDDLFSENGLSTGVDLIGSTSPQSVVSSDDETPQQDPPQEDPPEEDPLQEDPPEENPPQEEPSGVDIISLHSSDDSDESIHDAPGPPNNNFPPGTPQVQCDWVPPIGGNYPGPGTPGVRCPNMSGPHLQVQACDRGNHALHANGGIRNICHHHRAKIIFEDAYLAWWRQFRPVYCKPCSLERTNRNQNINPCTCAQNCYSIWRCMECSEHIRQPQRDNILTPARNRLLARVRRRVRGRWVYQTVAGARTRMACPTPGCYRKPWFRYHGHVADPDRFPRESAPIGNTDAWYRCLGCAQDIKIPPPEEPGVAIFGGNGDIVTQQARRVFPRIR